MINKLLELTYKTNKQKESLLFYIQLAKIDKIEEFIVNNNYTLTSIDKKLLKNSIIKNVSCIDYIKHYINHIFFENLEIDFLHKICNLEEYNNQDYIDLYIKKLNNNQKTKIKEIMSSNITFLVESEKIKSDSTGEIYRHSLNKIKNYIYFVDVFLKNIEKNDIDCLILEKELLNFKNQLVNIAKKHGKKYDNKYTSSNMYILPISNIEQIIKNNLKINKKALDISTKEIFTIKDKIEQKKENNDSELNIEKNNKLNDSKIIKLNEKINFINNEYKNISFPSKELINLYENNFKEYIKQLNIVFKNEVDEKILNEVLKDTESFFDKFLNKINEQKELNVSNIVIKLKSLGNI